MRYPIRLRVILIVLLLTGSLLPAVAQEGDATYSDPDGLYSVPIPTNWKAEPGDGFVTLSDPEGNILTHVVAVAGDDIAAAVDEAWGMVAPDFVFEPQQTQEVPSAQGVDHTLVLTALNDDQTHLYQAYAQAVGDTIYILLFDADVVAAQQRNSQILIIATGLTINAQTRTDLSGVQPLAFSDEIAAAFESYINDTLATLEVPGAAVAVVQGGEVVYAQGFGVKEQGKDDPVTAQTLMMIGSTTKSLTTLMMATLVDDGLMDWDEPVVDILPSFAVADPELSKSLTVRNLVCACTGVPRRDMEWLFNTQTAEGIVESLSTFRFFTDFGEAFQYSNQMVATGGYVAALAAGGDGDLYEAYLSVMQERVFDRIGMPGTTFSFEAVAARADHATPHGLTLRGEYMPIPLDEEAMLVQVAPAGAAWSNATDMARYLITELNEGVSPDGERVVSAENLAVTWEPQVAITADASYGLGWIIDSYKRQPMIQHNGNTFGFTSDLVFLPEADLGIVVLANARLSNLFTEAARYRLLELLFEQEAEYESTVTFALETGEENLAETEERLHDTLDIEAITPYLGTFGSPVLGEITLSLEGERLLLDAGEFAGELRGYTNDKGETVYVTYDPPIAGLPFALVESDGEPSIVLDIVTDQYTFSKAG